MAGRKVAVIGLGYVGLPVASAFAKKSFCIGFDINATRIAELAKGYDRTGELRESELHRANLLFTSDPADLRAADFFIVTVPTPIDETHRPDLSHLKSASTLVGRALKKNDVVVYESTVYPGATEEVCGPILESVSGLKCGVDFFIGYSPERINPGDKARTLDKITKIVSAQNADALSIVADTYGQIIHAGLYRASSIKVAEAAKVIENTQRDLNIALVNELALVFKRLNIDTKEVLEAAGTKWNFLKFVPGLVGGHCIGVDPYYLTFKAETMGHVPQVIHAGRKLNDAMGTWVGQQAIKQMVKYGHSIKGSCVTICGFTFKENCRDIRNTKVADIVRELKEYGVKVQVYDPLVNPEEAWEHYQIEMSKLEHLQPACVTLFTVAHDCFKTFDLASLKEFVTYHPILMDLKYLFSEEQSAKHGFHYWRL